MNPYNGFTGTERLQSWDLHKMYREDGVINWEKDCCDMCKQSGMEVMPHLENYFEVLSYKSLCIECHMNLHARFKMPRGWKRYLLLLREGYKPAAWNSVGQFFGSRKSKELFNIPNNLPIFESSGITDLKWYEELETTPVDLRSEMIQKGYSETHLKDLVAGYKVRRYANDDLILDE